ncbi:hypothetical protein GCM10025868_07180 [Angustibacter aerolatus]|uniref:ABC transmembrane type-1 domain-containing protein n=1 Tax=Angustibacter aerolatus TaxID=1162965 RepID=A0ABQ6JBA5_9ACTN|nr:ABC transporter permease subunit [Angustibacter aerolatus]GMA85468.1 hypothetical protein GCM10025868_07180 [Angustibacter aerolatus]
MRNTPLTLVLVFWGFAVPKLGIPIDYFPAACVGLVLYTAGFVCEAVRSGINTVPTGQAEAARALGLPFGAVLTEVVLPQALRASVPPLVSVLIALLKNTTVATAVNVQQAGSLPDYLSERGANQALRERLDRDRLHRAGDPVGAGAAGGRATDGGGGVSGASVLFDAPGPRARRRHRLIGVVSLLMTLALVGVVVGLMVATDQFSATRIAQAAVRADPARAARRLPGDAEGRWSGRRAGAAARRRARLGTAVGARVAAPSGDGGGRVLPRRAAADPDVLLLLRVAGVRARDQPDVVRGARVDALQRLGAGRGVPRRRRRGAPRSAGGRAGRRSAARAGAAAGAAAAGGAQHAALDRQPGSWCCSRTPRSASS